MNKINKHLNYIQSLYIFNVDILYVSLMYSILYINACLVHKSASLFFHFFVIFQKYFDGIVAHNYCIINTTMSNNQEGDDNDASQKVDNSQLSI
jgi:hypothetical protein